VEYKNSGIWTCEKEDGGRIPAPKPCSLGRMFLDIIISCEKIKQSGEEEEEEEEEEGELWREKEKQNLGGGINCARIKQFSIVGFVGR
jgi:hypothetical protein